MKIVAFLQNQWFKRPDVIRKVYAEHPDRREWLNSAYLFMGCKTGKMLTRALGEDLCGEIIWENVSPQIGGQASAVFPPDESHVRAVLEKHKPDVVLLFGKVAESVRGLVLAGVKVIVGPHPAARSPAVAALLREMQLHIAAFGIRRMTDHPFSDLPGLYWDCVDWEEPPDSPFWLMLLEDADESWWELKSRLTALVLESQWKLAA